MTAQLLLSTAAISALIVTIVQLFVIPYVPQGPKQNAIIRDVAVALGAILVPVAQFADGSTPVTAAALSVALAQGIALGATVTVGVAAAKTALKSAAAEPPKV